MIAMTIVRHKNLSCLSVDLEISIILIEPHTALRNRHLHLQHNYIISVVEKKKIENFDAATTGKVTTKSTFVTSETLNNEKMINVFMEKHKIMT